MKKVLKIDRKKETPQVFAIKYSIWVCFLIFIISLTAGLMVDSVALLLDASVSLITLFVTLFVHFAIKKIDTPPDDIYNFGYDKYEPLTIVLQGSLIIMTCLIGIKFAVQDLIHLDDIKRYDIPAISTIISAIVSLFMWYYLKRVFKKTGSGVIKTTSLSWFVDGVLSLGMCLGFLFGYIMRHLGYENITPYIDPGMTVILAVYFIRVPFKTITSNALELLDASPVHYIKDIVKKEAINTIINEHLPKAIAVKRVRARKAGKKIFIDICYLVNKNMTIETTQVISDAIEKDLKKYFPHCDVIVFFKAA